MTLIPNTLPGKEWLSKKKHFKVGEWPNQYLDLKLTENLRRESVLPSNSPKTSQLLRICMEDWTKIQATVCKSKAVLRLSVI